MVPSSGGGRKVIRTVFAGAGGVVAGSGERAGETLGFAVGTGAFGPAVSVAVGAASCALQHTTEEMRHAATIPIRHPRFAICHLNIVTPVQVGEEVIAPLAIRQKRFITGTALQSQAEAIKARQVLARPRGSVF